MFFFSFPLVWTWDPSALPSAAVPPAKVLVLPWQFCQARRKIMMLTFNAFVDATLLPASSGLLFTLHMTDLHLDLHACGKYCVNM